MYYYGPNTESSGPIWIATNDAGLYPWLIRRPVRECVTWAYRYLVDYLLYPPGTKYIGRYIVFAFSVIVFVYLFVCLSVNFYFLPKISQQFIPPSTKYIGRYIVFAFSVIVFVCLFVCLSVNFFFCQRFLSNYLT